MKRTEQNVIQITDEFVLLHVLVSPKSSRTGWGKIINNEAIQLKVNAPPVDGAANKGCIKFLAKEFKSNKSSIKIISGEKSRYKTFKLTQYAMDKVNEFIQFQLLSQT